MPTWREWLAGSTVARYEARLLAVHVSGRDAAWLAAHDTDEVPPEEAEALRGCLSRRAAGEPVAYILGEREFYGLALQVTPDVLIPRPETELLVELALERLPPGGRLLDVGTGSGAVAIAVAHSRPDARVFASDISAPALAVAQANCRRHGVNVGLLRADLLRGWGAGVFDVVASNPPYIAAGDPHLGQGDLRFEPAIALTDRSDGLQILRRLAREALFCLRSGGWLLAEHGYDQGPRCSALWRQNGYRDLAEHPDLALIERVCAGTKP